MILLPNALQVSKISLLILTWELSKLCMHYEAGNNSIDTSTECPETVNWHGVLGPLKAIIFSHVTNNYYEALCKT